MLTQQQQQQAAKDGQEEKEGEDGLARVADASDQVK
jgi:hypothetical protein